MSAESGGGDGFRELIFATQEPEQLMAGIDRSGSFGEPWLSFDRAVTARKAGRDGEAAKALRGVLELGGETRTWIWALNGLRALGLPPPEDLAGQVLGVVLEVPVADGLDTLAAYADGSARYINHSGSIIVWDEPPPHALHEQFSALFPAVIELSGSLPPGRPKRPGPAEIGLTVLTAEGPLFTTAAMSGGGVSGPVGAVFQAASLLLAALVALAEKGPSGAEDPDLGLLRSGQGEQRWKALGRIIEKGPGAAARALPAMIECLPDADGPLKLLLLTALTKLGPQAAAALHAAAEGHADGRVREHAAAVRRQLGEG